MRRIALHEMRGITSLELAIARRKAVSSAWPSCKLGHRLSRKTIFSCAARQSDSRSAKRESKVKTPACFWR
eukprot:scaffold41896_cov69-Phaeocystis_antarctica.AAC.5